MAKTTIKQVLKIDGAFLAKDPAIREERLGAALQALLEASGKATGYDFNEIASAEEFELYGDYRRMGFYADAELDTNKDGKGDNDATVKLSFDLPPAFFTDPTVTNQTIAFNLRQFMDQAGALAGFAVPESVATVTETAPGEWDLTVEFVLEWAGKAIEANGVNFTGDESRIEAATEEALANGFAVLPDDATATENPDGSVTIDLPAAKPAKKAPKGKKS